MELLESFRVAIKELVLPELDKIREENREIKALLSITNKRLDDVNIHLADQSRRIDSLREELTLRIEETNNRIDKVRDDLTLRMDETNKRIDSVLDQLTLRIDSVREELTQRIDSVRDQLTLRIDSVREELSYRLGTANQRLDTLYEVVVRRDDHFQLANRVTAVERELADLRQKLAA